jgi:6,7-dimethyl-8-ribityllumazine synthase
VGTPGEVGGSREGGGGRRAALIVARFNDHITTELTAGARDALIAAGVSADAIDEYHVAGAFELAPACRQVLANDREYDLLIALGAIVRGATPHFDVLATTVTQALQQLANELTIPLAMGVLTCDTLEQAEARADRRGLDRGGEAARAALAQAALYDQLQERRLSVRGFRLP